MEKLEYQKICLDTNILVELLRKKSETIEKVKSFQDDNIILATTIINSFELYYGAYKPNRSKNIDLVKELLDKLVILEWDDDFSEVAGKVLADLDRKGQKIEFRDLFIGVIAFRNDFTLITNNLSHFKRIQGLKVKSL